MLDVGKIGNAAEGGDGEGFDYHSCHSSKQQRAAWHQQSTQVCRDSVIIVIITLSSS